MLKFLHLTDGESLSAGLESYYAGLRDSQSTNRARSVAADILNDTWEIPKELDSLVEALIVTAQRIDSGEWSILKEDYYHNTPHFCEVPCNTHVLFHLNGGTRYNPPLNMQRHLETVLAGFLHDICHDGSVNGNNLYKLEKDSFRTAKPMLIRCGVPRETIRRIRFMLLSTEVSADGRKALKYIHDLHETGKMDNFDAALIPAGFDKDLLRALRKDRTICRQCAILGDADILGSTGLNLKHARDNTLAFSLERGWPTRPEDVRKNLKYFLDNVFIDHITPGAKLAFGENTRIIYGIIDSENAVNPAQPAPS
ncbi:MAG TPA: hypothetical protein VHB73_03955 [Alphaproteobacteria bacterium]|nr:hypothetical protein [Alphaproteobacteria bacterium]